MKLTILETGYVPLAIRDRFPDYPAMFRTLLAPVMPGVEFETVDVIGGDVLPDPETPEAVLITGSPAGVYDPEPWLPQLMAFIRAAAAAGVPMVGICFGHQVMAEALGGKVIKSPKGWGVGRHSYDLKACPGWTGGACPETISIAASHQDQVVIQPPDTAVLAASDFTPYAALAYSAFPGLSFQCHPEFAADYSTALYESREGRPLTAAEVRAATASLQQPLDNGLLATWIARFLSEAVAARAG